MPSASISSSLSRRPAVSINRIGSPSSEIVASKVSRVVPGVAVTIARSALASAFKRLDLPAFGAPISTTSAPVDNSSPGLDISISSPISSLNAVMFFLISLFSILSTGSSEKSIFASINTLSSLKLAHKSVIFLEKCPSSDLSAHFAAVSV